MQIITTEFIENFNELSDAVADVHIKHLLYGKQKIKRCILHPFVDGDRIGLRINNEEIYIKFEELVDVKLENSKCIIKSELMELYIYL